MLLIAVFVVIKYYRFDSVTKSELLETGVFSIPERWMIYWLNHVQIIIYLILSFKLIYEVKKKARNYFSDTNKMDFSWLQTILFGFSLVILGDISYFILKWIITPAPNFMINYIYSFVLIIAIYIVLNGLRKPERFRTDYFKEKYKKSNLQMDEKETIKKRLENTLINKKICLEPNITLSDLAKEITIHPKYLSQVINECYQQSFYDFVNLRRIEEAKLLLADKKQNLTIQEVFYDVGFNSKSSFNKAFKKYTNKTPTEFKEQS
jgi:AraC-like DNA-binding protein